MARRPPGRNPGVDFKGQPRANDTHASTTDSDARLFKKSEGTASRLCHMSQLLVENRNGLVVDVATMEANGKTERQAALMLLAKRCCASPPTTWSGWVACRACGMRGMCRAKSARIPPKGGKTAWKQAILAPSRG